MHEVFYRTNWWKNLFTTLALYRCWFYGIRWLSNRPRNHRI